MVVLPPLVVKKLQRDMKTLPLARWKEEVDDQICSDKGYREDMPVDVLLSLHIGGHWILAVWCFYSR